MSTVHDLNKKILKPLLNEFRQGNPEGVKQQLKQLVSPSAPIRLGEPFDEITGPEALWEEVYEPLYSSFPDLERRDFIFMSGPRWGDNKTGDWVGFGGNFIGNFAFPWLSIPASGKPVFMRYHEYWQVEDGIVTAIEGLWDIPQIMNQVGVWPFARQIGVEWLCPGPADGRGVITEHFNSENANISVKLVWDMLHELAKGDAKDPDRGLGSFWHPDALWYGSCGIGSAKGHKGITQTVLSGFRQGLSENSRHLEDGVFFGDQNLVAFTGWPSAHATHSGDGFLGLAPTGVRFERRSLDFWRIEQGMIRENWVMVDLIHIYRQLGVDIFDRMNKLAIWR